MSDLLDDAGANQPYRPLADRMRPTTLAEFFGQQHVLAEGGALRQAIEAGNLHSMVFWGPPGTGKTTLAKIIAHSTNAAFISLSAVFSGVKDIRSAIEQAKQYRAEGRSTILFVDEVHRFNKSQQDAFLPYVEDGTIFFVGATTENPSFELNNALLSRVKTYVLKSLPVDEIKQLLRIALLPESGLANAIFVLAHADPDALAALVVGDYMRSLTLREISADLTACAASIKAAIIFTIRSARCTNLFAAPIPMRRCTGSRAWSMVAVIRFMWRGVWCASLRKISAMLIRVVYSLRWMPGRLMSVWAVPKVSWPLRRRSPIWPAPPRVMRCTWPGMRRWPMHASLAAWKCLCMFVMPRPG